jgi:hypothetical protein
MDSHYCTRPHTPPHPSSHPLPPSCAPDVVGRERASDVGARLPRPWVEVDAPARILTRLTARARTLVAAALAPGPAAVAAVARTRRAVVTVRAADGAVPLAAQLAAVALARVDRGEAVGAEARGIARLAAGTGGALERVARLAALDVEVLAPDRARHV